MISRICGQCDGDDPDADLVSRCGCNPLAGARCRHDGKPEDLGNVDNVESVVERNRALDEVEVKRRAAIEEAVRRYVDNDKHPERFKRDVDHFVQAGFWPEWLTYPRRQLGTPLLQKLQL